MKKGFTLIELLVVIAIIGVLSSVVIASLTVARKKAGDARVKQQLVQVRSAAAIYFDTNGTYGLSDNVCTAPNTVFSDPKVAPLVTNTNYPSNTLLACHSNGTNYAVSASLSGVTSGDQIWCVDSMGRSMLIPCLNTLSDDCETAIGNCS